MYDVQYKVKNASKVPITVIITTIKLTKRHIKLTAAHTILQFPYTKQGNGNNIAWNYTLDHIVKCFCRHAHGQTSQMLIKLG
jgi:hypothetical protein